MSFSTNASIENNQQLRAPQREGSAAVRAHFRSAGAAREVGVVLPVGCGKSGLIVLMPFALAAKRALVIAPGLRIRKQLAEDLKVNSPKNVYERFGVLSRSEPFPETVVVEGGRINLDDLLHCDVAVANIHQVASEENLWLDGLDPGFFDLILVDEAHHNLAASWQQVKARL